MTFKLLVIEDEVEIQEGLKTFLEEAGYHIDIANDGLEGLEKFHNEKYDLILLDIMLPKIDGFGFLELIRKESDVPVIMITAMSEEEAQIKCFDLKIEDYIIKPFMMSIVLKRIEVVLRRVSKQEINPPHQILNYKRLSLDIESCEVFVSNKKVSLTRKEFEMVKLFLENQNLVFSREKILDELWGAEFFGSENLIDVHIKNIRKKLGVNYIQTVRGMGFKIDRED